jgi:hypothetical protein
MPYVPRSKQQVMKGRDNRHHGQVFGEVTLRCGHQAHGEPRLSNPDKWFCGECRSYELARKRAA